jgi:hypothetical protein
VVADQASDKGQAVGHQRRKPVAAVAAAIEDPRALAAGRPGDGMDVGEDLGIGAGRCPGVGLQRFDPQREPWPATDADGSLQQRVGGCQALVRVEAVVKASQPFPLLGVRLGPIGPIGAAPGVVADEGGGVR